MGAWRYSTETQQSGHAPNSGSEVKNGRSRAKDGALEWLGCRTVKEEVNNILQRVSAGAARKILLQFYPTLVREQEKAVTVATKSGQFTTDETGKGQFL